MIFPKKPLSFSLSLGHIFILLNILVGLAGAFYLWRHETQIRVFVFVPKRTLPAYHQVQSDDLIRRFYLAKDLTSETLRDLKQIEKRYTLVAVPRYKPLTQEQLVVPERIKDTVAIAIPATPSMIFGGTLKAGDSVDILVVPTVKEGQPPAQPVPFKNILVLDVKSMQQSFVVVIALPLERHEEFATVSTKATLWLTQKF